MVRIDSYSGNFNYLNSKDRSTIVRIYLPEDAPENVLDESWAEGDEPDTDIPPSEMVELFSKRLAAYLFNSARPRKERLIAWCRAKAARLDREWAETKIAALRKEIASAEKQIASAEKQIKRWLRPWKFQLVEAMNPHWTDLDPASATRPPPFTQPDRNPLSSRPQRSGEPGRD